jgi:hypothetical protein
MSVLTRLSCLALLLVVPELVLAAAPPRSEPVLAEFAFDRDGPIVVPLKIKGKSYPFMVDTGCTISVFDPALCSLLGAKVRNAEVNTPGGPARVTLFRAPEASVGELPFPQTGAVGVHGVFALVREQYGVGVWGALGMDFLQSHGLRVDFDRGRVAFLRSGRSFAGHRLPLVWSEGGCPCVEARVERDAEPVRFIIDTGDISSGSLGRVIYQELKGRGKLRHAGQMGGLTASGTDRLNLGQLDCLKLGPFEHKNLYFKQASTISNPRLGLTFWSRYRVVFDFKEQVAYLRKNSRHARPDAIDGSGLGMLLEEGLAIVSRVEERSPAAKAGIRKGDEVVLIAGRKAAGANLVVLRKLLEGKGRTVRVVVRRDSRDREVPLRLEVAWRIDQTKR